MLIRSSFRDYYDFVMKSDTDHSVVYDRENVIDVSHLKITNTMHTVLTSATRLSSKYRRGEHYKLTRYTPKSQASYIFKSALYRFHEVSILGNIIVYIEQLYSDRNKSFFRLATRQDYLNYLIYHNAYPDSPPVYMHPEPSWVDTKRFFQFWATNMVGNKESPFIQTPTDIDKYPYKCPGVCLSYKNINYPIHKRLRIPVISELEVDENNVISKVYTYELYRIEGLCGLYPPHRLYHDIEQFIRNL